MKPTLLILAAGMGSRYGGLKQVDPVGPNGEILLEYSAYDALRAGFGRLVFIIRKDIEEAFRSSIGARVEGKIPVDYAFQELDQVPSGFTVPPGRSKPWGTGHAILCARDQVHEPFVAINADDFYGPSSYRLVADFLKSNQDDYAMVGFRLRNTLSEHGSVSRGVCVVDEGGWLKSVDEQTAIEKKGDGAVSERGPLTGDEVVSMNFWGLRPSIFAELERLFREFLETQADQPKSELYIPKVLDRLIQDKQARVQVLASSESWFGVTYPEDKPIVVEQIRRKIQEGVYPEELWSNL